MAEDCCLVFPCALTELNVCMLNLLLCFPLCFPRSVKTDVVLKDNNISRSLAATGILADAELHHIHHRETAEAWHVRNVGLVHKNVIDLVIMRSDQAPAAVGIEPFARTHNPSSKGRFFAL